MANNKVNVVFGADTSQLSSGVRRAKGELSGLRSTALSIGKTLGGIFAIRQIGRVAGDIIQVTAEFQSLKAALNGIKGADESLDGLVNKAKQLAALPGIGLSESVRALVQLKSAGLSTQVAETTIKEIANAAVGSGGGVQEFSQAIYAIAQIKGNAKLMGQDLNQLKNSIPSLGAALKTAFGSTVSDGISEANKEADTFINKLNEVLATGARIEGGLGNDISNLSNAFKELKIAIGSAFGAEFAAAVARMTGGISNIKSLIDEAERFKKGESAFFGQRTRDVIESDLDFNRQMEEGDNGPVMRVKGAPQYEIKQSMPSDSQSSLLEFAKGAGVNGEWFNAFTEAQMNMKKRAEKNIAIEQTVRSLEKGIDLSKEKRDGLSMGPVVSDSLTRIGGGGGAWGGSNPMVRKMDQQITKLEQQISLLEDIKAKGPMTLGQ